jgi:hypothetical protein
MNAQAKRVDVRPITIGTQWLDRNGRECKVIDIYTTTSTAGCVISVEYLSFHKFMGQRVEHTDCATTIRMGMARLAERNSLCGGRSNG